VENEDRIHYDQFSVRRSV